MTRRTAAEWLARLGGVATVAGLAALPGCTSTQTTTTRRRVTISDEAVRSPRTRSTPPPTLDTPGSRALERYRNAQREVPLPMGVVPRTTWASAGPIVSRARPMGKVTRLTVHHDGMTPFTSVRQNDAMRRIESIRRAHVGSEGWADIGYHYVIDPGGRVYEARPLTLQGAHVKYNNEQNVGVMVLGNFQQQRPSPAALTTLDAFVAERARVWGIPANRIYTHQELRPTACPGRSLQRHMLDARSKRGALALALA